MFALALVFGVAPREEVASSGQAWEESPFMAGHRPGLFVFLGSPRGTSPTARAQNQRTWGAQPSPASGSPAKGARDRLGALSGSFSCSGASATSVADGSEAGREARNAHYGEHEQGTQ